MWCGTASLLVESGGTRLLFDPYLRKYDKKGAPFPMDEARGADAVFITHPHPDHFSDMDAFSDRPVYVSARGVAIAGRNGMNTDRMRVLAAGETVRTGGLCVTAYRGRHCSFDMPTVSRVLFSPHTWLHIGKAMRLLGEAKRFSILPEDVFVFSVTDGEKTAVILGSAGMAKGEDYPQNADLLVLPYQGKAAMHRKIAPFLDAFRPKKVMIDHFDDAFPPVSSRVPTKKFPAAVKKRLPQAEALIPEYNVWYDV